MSKFCTQCGNAVEDTATFCTQCGNSLGAVQQPEAQPAYQQPQQPVYQQPQQPVYQQPVYQQPVYQQPVYQQPIYQPVYQQPQPQGNGVGTAGMVLGIIGMVFTVIGTIILYASGFYGAAVTLIFWLIGGILMLPGFPLSLAGLFGKKPKGRAVAGLILNLLILILWVYLFAAGGSFFRILR